MNQLIQSTDPATGITLYGHDAAGHLNQVTDPRLLVTGYTVNGFGDVTQIQSPDTGVTARSFDPAGNVITSKDARNLTTSYTYDALNRLTNAAYADGTSAVYQYDKGTNGKGRLTEVTDVSGTTQFKYDKHGRVTKKTQNTGSVMLTMLQSFNTAGQLHTSTATPQGGLITYSYDAAGQVNQIKVKGKVFLTGVQHQPFGPVAGWHWSDGSVYQRSFDSDGRLASFPLGSDSRSIGYDTASRIQTLTDANTSAQQVFGYDGLDRLTSHTAPGVSQGYAYDADGNRQTLTTPSTTLTYGYGAGANALLSLSAPATSYAYDAAGNLTGDGMTTYTYDARGRLVNAAGTDYAINGLGQRVAKTNAGDPRLFLFGQEGMLRSEYTAAGKLIQETIWLDGLPVGVRTATGVFRTYADQLGAARLITASTGTALWQWESDPFGNGAPNQNPSGSGTFTYNPRFPGQYYDSETGLHHNGARNYDPTSGRYVQSDPIGLVGGVNTYAYAGANPIGAVDPSGLSPDQACYPQTLSCPPSEPIGSPEWRPYWGKGGQTLFHCGGTVYLENSSPLPNGPINECVYNSSHGLISHYGELSECAGTPDFYDEANPLHHFFLDPGGPLNLNGIDPRDWSSHFSGPIWVSTKEAFTRYIAQ